MKMKLQDFDSGFEAALVRAGCTFSMEQPVAEPPCAGLQFTYKKFEVQPRDSWNRSVSVQLCKISRSHSADSVKCFAVHTSGCLGARCRVYKGRAQVWRILRQVCIKGAL